jgi:hypothetical protein
MMTSISEARTVPVQEDLTTEELRLSVLRGLETAFRVDFPIASGVNLEMGDWAVLGADGKLTTPGAAGVQQTYLVFAGNDRYDAKATGQATVFLNSNLVVKTSKFNTAGVYAPGTPLTYKDLGGGDYKLTVGVIGTDAILGFVIERAGDNYLVFETTKNISA